MTQPVFDFLGVVSDQYPQSSLQVSFGRGYQFATAPLGPDQVKTTVSFPKGLFYFDDPITHALVPDANPTINAYALRLFYENVRCYGVFTFVHPIRGVGNYRFSEPVAIPAIMDDPGAVGSYGGYRAHQTAAFTTVLILQP